MRTELAAKLGTSLQSRKGLDRLAEREGKIAELARWLRSDQAKALEQEELDPKAPDGKVVGREVSPGEISAA